MICPACQRGEHNRCEEGDCQCPDREMEQFQRRIARDQNDVGLAEAIYSNLLGTGGSLTSMLTDGAGRENVLLFIAVVLQAKRALTC